MTKQTSIEAVVRSLLRRRGPSAQSLIVTLFGDCVSQHGGSLWLGSLIQALGLLGINERSTRTSVFRLVQDDWLAVERVGRRSYYRFAPHGQREFERVARRVYAIERARWDGTWTLAILHAVSGDTRDALRTSLGWIGFGQLAPGVFAHPSPDRQALLDLVEEQGVGQQVLIMDARIAESASIPELAHSRWRLPELGERYRHFVDDFEPVTRALPKRADPQLCFVVRTLLIHEYRRILLTDPDLPDALLPDAWPGRRAAELTKALYFAASEGSTDFVMRAFENEAGPLPKPAAGFFRRFEGQGESSTSIRSKPRKRMR
jgi:phenylacetic acid degradation operon negative regulatory protein